MRMVGYPKAFYHVARLRIHRPSTKVRKRLRCLRVWEMLKARGAQVSEVVKAVDVPRATLYRWQAQLRKWGTRGLEPKSRRPKRVRRPACSPEAGSAQVLPQEHIQRKHPRLTPISSHMS